MKLLPTPLTLTALLLPRGGSAVASQGLAQGLDEAALPHTRSAPRTAAEPDWRSAYQRRRAQDEEPAAEPTADAWNAVPPLAAWVPREAAPDVPAVRAAVPATATTERVEALRQLAEAPAAAQPVARVWQVDLPATPGVAGPGWQLHVEQAQPQAPLALDLRVPPAAQTQARQQLSDLDKRLRDAGHDVLRPRVRDAARSSKRSRPVDEVDS
jgi:hypothetical protein